MANVSELWPFQCVCVCVGILDAYVCVWGDKGVNSSTEAHQSMKKKAQVILHVRPNGSLLKAQCVHLKGVYWHEVG